MTLTRGAAHGNNLQRARASFLALGGSAQAATRAAEIAQLPSKDWKGKQVYQLHCLGGSGNGPHDLWVPEALLWSLISLSYFRCPYHL